MDTQWPRYQVFLQEKEGVPHQDAGSVHAPDPELALLNARDVFVRRPSCVSLWVVPAEVIYSRTVQELEEKGVGEPDNREKEGNNTIEIYLVFCKEKAAGTQTHIGEVQATNRVEALRLALTNCKTTKKPFAWWVFPARLVTSSGPGDLDSMFTPAHEKTFRLSTEFHTLTAMRKLKNSKNKG